MINKNKYLRDLWFKFFESKNHLKINSASLLPYNDNTLLWINSGVAGLKDFFSGKEKPANKALVNIQKCIRTNDLDNVGKTLRHHSFFEMMGHFSIGGYFKKEAIEYCWEFLTSSKWLNLDIKKLYITVYKEDYDAQNIWINDVKIAKDHLILCSRERNFWDLGNGPCGPNSEIYYDRGKKYDKENIGIDLLKKDIENNRYLEIWNIVFSEFNNVGNNKYLPLPNKNIDTGVGYERLLSILENTESNFETSLFYDIKQLIIKSSSLPKKTLKEKTNIIRIRKICDFSRTIAFVASENILPSSKDRGFILKKLIRLVTFNYTFLKIKPPFIIRAINKYVNVYKDSYKEFKSLNTNLLKKIEEFEIIEYEKLKEFIVLQHKIEAIKTENRPHYYFHFEDVVKNNKIIFDKIKNFYLPYNRFKEYETFGKWNDDLKPLIQNCYDFLNIQFVDNSYRFSILMPPPNITGNLHLGHAYDLYIQDTLIREKKLFGYDTIYIPGKDHAGIATQLKVENLINKQFKTKKNHIISYDEFYKYASEWKISSSQLINDQWKTLGLLPNYEYEQFTLNEDSQKIVNETFALLYNDGLIYQAEKLVNWDVKLNSAISDLEVEYRKTNIKLYYFKYFLKDSPTKYLLVATTRPETMFADVCLFVNPKDKRYLKFINQKVINPVNNEAISIFSDEYVDISFGTGVMKCTPGHDFNDYELSKKHNLLIKSCIGFNGKMLQNIDEFSNLDLYECREKLVAKLKQLKLLEKIESFNTNISYSQRTNVIVQPLLSKQWFIKTKKLADWCIDLQLLNKQPLFIPKSFANNYLKWLKNINDWCISRQIIWGHRFPIWYDKKTNKITHVGNKPKNSHLYYQDKNVLDTWFSSGLWPLITLKFHKNMNFFETYYQFSVLVTGYDILFFWVCRMTLLCSYVINKYNLKNKTNFSLIPFEKIFLHGLIRDAKGIKMSKSNNNGIDPIHVIDQYGSDALRMFFLLEKQAGLDINFHIEGVQKQWGILNKLWNSYLFIEKYSEKYQTIYNHLNNNIKDYHEFELKSSYYFLRKFYKFLHKIHKINIVFIKTKTNYINEKLYKEIIKFCYDWFCGKFIEHTKYYLNCDSCSNNEIGELLFVLRTIFCELLILLNPICPFFSTYVFKKLTTKNIYEFNSVLLPNIYFQILNYAYRNFQHNLIIPIKKLSVIIDDSLGDEIFDEIWNQLLLLNKKHKFVLRFSVRNELALIDENISLLLGYLSQKRLKFEKKWVIFDYNFAHGVNAFTIKLHTYNATSKAGTYIVFYALVSKELLTDINLVLKKTILKNQKELLFLDNKINKLNNVLNLTNIKNKSKLQQNINDATLKKHIIDNSNMQLSDLLETLE